MNKIWSYCSSGTHHEGRLSCVQLGYRNIPTSANRDVVFRAEFSGWTHEYTVIDFLVKNFRVGAWNHFCWSYSGTTGSNKLYYNGRMVVDLQVDEGLTPLTIEGNDDLSKYAFVIGQEPDSLRGGYTADQAFYGHIAELNMWDKVMDEVEIAALGLSLIHI